MRPLDAQIVFDERSENKERLQQIAADRSIPMAALLRVILRDFLSTIPNKKKEKR